MTKEFPLSLIISIKSFSIYKRVGLLKDVIYMYMKIEKVGFNDLNTKKEGDTI